jgi:hypothetical protein
MAHECKYYRSKAAGHIGKVEPGQMILHIGAKATYCWVETLNEDYYCDVKHHQENYHANVT